MALWLSENHRNQGYWRSGRGAILAHRLAAAAHRPTLFRRGPQGAVMDAVAWGAGKCERRHLEPSDKRAPISSVRTAPVDPSADAALGLARTPNGLDARSFLA